jgi:rubrerythrin
MIMENDNIIAALKQAIILEHRGRSLYEKVAELTPSKEVAKIFNIMAEEEQMHIEYLSRQLVNYQKNGKFQKNSFQESASDHTAASAILTEDIVNQISGAGFEAAAISAAIDMENKSIEFYTLRSRDSSDQNERELFHWLADWEKGHHKLLIDLNKQLTEKIWYDNNFWPF